MQVKTFTVDYESRPRTTYKRSLGYEIFYRECISEQLYNLSELLNSNPPRAEMSDLPKNSITEDVKKLQKKMQKLFQKQKEKGGIIDLEAEKNKFLVVTNSNDGSENKADTQFEELSPTDYQLGKVLIYR